MKIVAFALALVAAAPLIVGAQTTSGTVTVSFTVTRAHRIASDQFAVWIEDSKGTFVRTLFVTNFVGRRAGWKIRPQTTPSWIKAAQVKDVPQKQIDAVSSATPPDGALSVIWDLKDGKGNVVPPGTYLYKVEGNISWENTVLWTGSITTGGADASSRASAVYSPEGAQKLGSLITDVAAVYAAGKP